MTMSLPHTTAIPSPGPTQEEFEEPYIFTTIRYQPGLSGCAENTVASCRKPCPFYMLEHHWTRLQVAKWSVSLYSEDRPKDGTSEPSQLFHGLQNAVEQWRKSHPGENPEALRIKLRAYAGGKITTETCHPLLPLPMSSLFPRSFGVPGDHPSPVRKIVLDSEATEPSEATMFKTSNRYVYARARAAAGITSVADESEVLLYTPDGHALDGSITTPYFYRNGKWVVPGASSGGLQGTTRRWALENWLCVEDVVLIGSLEPGEIVWLSNAVRGYYPAKFIPRSGHPSG